MDINYCFTNFCPIQGSMLVNVAQSLNIISIFRAIYDKLQWNISFLCPKWFMETRKCFKTYSENNWDSSEGWWFAFSSLPNCLSEHTWNNWTGFMSVNPEELGVHGLLNGSELSILESTKSSSLSNRFFIVEFQWFFIALSVLKGENISGLHKSFWPPSKQCRPKLDCS